MHLYQRMDKENMAQFTMQYCTIQRLKKNDILKFACKWMEVENTILSDVTQTQKDEHGIYSLLNEY